MFKYLIKLGFYFNKSIISDILRGSIVFKLAAELYVYLGFKYGEDIDLLAISRSSNNRFENITNTFLFQDKFLEKYPEKFKQINNVHPDIKLKYSYIFDGNKLGLI